MFLKPKIPCSKIKSSLSKNKNWNFVQKDQPKDQKIGFKNVESKPITKNNLSEGEVISFNKAEIISFGLLDKGLCLNFDLEIDILYAEIDLTTILNKYSNKPIQFKSISKFPEVTRDLSILIDKELKFEKIHKAIKQINQKLIKEIILFDVYDGENLAENKKSEMN